MKNKKYLYIFLIMIPIIIFFVGRSFSLEYTQEIRKVEIESDDYDDPGSWHIDKSAKWVSFSEAEVNFDLNTIYKEREDANYKDVILVIDISGSMGGEKLDKAKSDAMELVDTLLSNQNNHVALITFDSESEIVSDFTNDKDELLGMIENLSTEGCTNYNAGLLNVLEVMEEYQKDDSHDLITLFLTDGFPNVDIPNQVATYNIIKDKYPYMTVNGIQYEMGDEIIQEIVDISDNQWIANQETLNGVLFDAVIIPLPYETFVVSDYIYKDYFYLDSISDVTVTKGTVALQEENGLQKIVWTLDDNLTGFNANMKIKLQLKTEYTNESGFYPTNDHETIDYNIINEDEETINSTLTPVLKRTYNVIYDKNAPEGCNLPDIPSEEHYVYENVSKRSETLVCAGYTFLGYQFDDNNAADITKINEDTFIMPEHDVIFTAVWGQNGLVKSMDGTVYERLEGTLMQHNYTLAETFGKRISKDNFEKIITVDNIDVPSNAIDSWDVSQEQNESVIAWYTDTDNDSKYELYIGQEEGVIANPDSSYAFCYFNYVEEIDLTNFDTSNVTNMNNMFARTGNSITTPLNIIGINNFDTSNVTNMSQMFNLTGYNSTSFNLNISNWNTSNVTNMSNMFESAGYKAQTFSMDLSSWNTSNVTNMASMFSYTGYSATTFNIGDLSEWDTSNVNEMNSMFNYMASKVATFEMDLSGWNTSNVTTMSSMFNSTGMNATTWSVGDLSEWDTQKLTDMSYMFVKSGYNASTWSVGDIKNWDTSEVTNMSSLFSSAGYNATSFVLDLNGWDTSKVNNMGSMFNSVGYKSNNFNINLSGFNTSQVTNMSNMFENAGHNATTWNVSYINGFNTSKVTRMYNMFYNAGYSATTWNIGNLDNWDTSKVEDMGNMFYSAGYSATTWNIGNLSNWNTGNVTTMTYMFSYAGYKTPSFVLDLSNWNTVKVNTMSYMFSNAGRDSTTWSVGDLSRWDTSSVTTMAYMFFYAGYNSQSFNLNVSNWDVSKVTNMNYMFGNTGYSASSFNLNLSNWSSTNGANMGYMFNNTGYSATAFTLNLNDFNPIGVTNMSHMFTDTGNNASTLNLDLSNWNVSNVTDMTSMFQRIGYKSTTWTIGDLSGWGVSNVSKFSSMFQAAGYYASTFDVGNLGAWTISNATTLDSMFDNAGYSATTWNIGDLSNWNTSNVTRMYKTFFSSGHEASNWSIGNLNNWNVSNVTTMYGMFGNSGYNSTTWGVGDLSNWDTSKVTTMEYMFTHAGYNSTTFNSIGTLKIYATNITRMINNSKLANATFNIYSNPTSYTDTFNGTATSAGSGITVNYSSTTTNIDAIIATKSSGSNVVKGVQLD